MSEETEDSVQNQESTDAEKKENEESIWASFKKDVDVGSTQPKVTPAVETVTETQTITKEFEFAGEKIK